MIQETTEATSDLTGNKMADTKSVDDLRLKKEN